VEITENDWRKISFYLQDDTVWEKRKNMLNYEGPDRFSSYLSHLTALNNPLRHRQFLDQVIKYSKLVHAESLERLLQHHNKPLHFVFVSIANLLNAEIETIYNEVFSARAPEVCSGLSDDLFAKLLNILLPSVELELAVYLNAYEYPDTRENLLRFVLEASASAEWIEYFFEQYPVAAIRIERLIRNYMDYLSEFFGNLRNDIDKLKEEFQIGCDRQITKINTGLGDLHHSARSTIRICFDDGTTVYYKPRNLNSEKVFYNIYNGLLSIGLKRSILETRSIICKDYAWQLGVVAAEVSQISEASEFYYNQGITTAIAYVFNIQDLISDNIISVGKYAALIDLEIFMHPAYPYGLSYKTNSLSGRSLLHGVIKTGMVPQFGFESVNNPGQSNSGISVFSVGEDFDRNVPFFNGEAVPIDGMEAHFEEGFIYAYQFFKNHQEKIYELILTQHEACPNFNVRTILRYTYKYTILAEKLNYPEILQDHLRYANVIEFLWRGYNETILPEKIIQSEIEQVFSDDVPLFCTKSDSRDLFDVGGNLLVKDYFPGSGLELIKEKFSRLGQDDLDEQLNVIRRALIIHHEYEAKPTILPPFTDERLIDQIRISLGSLNRYQGKQFAYIDYTITKDSLWSQDIQDSDLFQGIPGLGVFFIASHVTFGKQTDLDNAVSIFDQTVEYLKKTKTDILDNPLPSLGMVNYPLSILYMSYLYTEITGSDHFALDSDTFGFLIDFIKLNIKKDAKKDYLFGSVGLGLLLLRIYQKRPEAEILEVVITLGDYLVESKLVVDQDKITWESSSHDKWGGFAHGTASSAYFLFRLHELTGKADYRDCALKALKYDQCLYDRHLGYWKKTIEVVGDRHHGWSNGDAGIALGRFLSKEYFSDPVSENEMEIVRESIERNIRFYLDTDHSICSGFMGLLELHTLMFNDPKKEDKWLMDFDSKFKTVKSLKCGGWYQNQEITGLYYGYAGIGYNYLKLKFNKQLPSLLYL
jgi:lantibiotic modifying enzyme